MQNKITPSQNQQLLKHRNLLNLGIFLQLCYLLVFIIVWFLKLIGPTPVTSLFDPMTLIMFFVIAIMGLYLVVFVQFNYIYWGVVGIEFLLLLYCLYQTGMCKEALRSEKTRYILLLALFICNILGILLKLDQGAFQ